VRETFKILYINKMGNYATKTELSAQVDAINARLSETDQTELSAQVDAINARLSEIESLTLIQQPLQRAARAACIKTTAMPALANIDAESVFHKSKRQVAEAICPCFFDDEESCNVGGRLEQLCSGDRISKDGECEAWETYMDSVVKEYAQRPEASESARRVAFLTREKKNKK